MSNIFSLPTTETEAIELFQSHGIIRTTKICSKGHKMRLKVGTRIEWVCTQNGCHTHLSIRKETWNESFEFCKQEL